MRKNLILGIGLLLAAALVDCAISQEKGRPLKEDDLVKLVELGIDDDTIAGKIATSGIGFAPDAAALDRLKNAGASSAVLEALKKSAAKKSPAAPAGAITYQDIVKLLELGIDEPAILKKLEQSPTRFVLGADQVDELKKLGASGKLLAALARERAQPDQTGDVTDFAIVLDCSGSMMETMRDGHSKMEAAKKAVTELVHKFPEGLRLTFIIYGHDKKLECKAVKIARELSVLDASGKAALTKEIAALQPVGGTPIALALQVAGQELFRNDAYCGLVLISDGKESCKGNPVAEAARLAENPKLRMGVNVIGFDVKADEREALEAIAAAGKGKYHGANSADELEQALPKAIPLAEPKKAVVRRRAIKVLKPSVQFPALKTIAVFKADQIGPNTAASYSPVGGATKFDQEIALPSADKYDIFWRSETGQWTPMILGFSNPERKLIEIKPEDYMGLVRLGGQGLPKPEIVVLVKPGGFGPGEAAGGPAYYAVQYSKNYGEIMVVAAGKYDLWIQPAGGKGQKLESDLEVEPGKLVELD
ncbi:MAG TPA: VWA domain-containing protein [Pirellulales bacterium]|jgi:hypothetical protein|nr:VWA domain-containing protein [Pirellulales bacterium]